ncbi:hypothetical protein KIPB_006996, partial [Kipferlia bialata]
GQHRNPACADADVELKLVTHTIGPKLTMCRMVVSRGSWQDATAVADVVYAEAQDRIAKGTRVKITSELKRYVKCDVVLGTE